MHISDKRSPWQDEFNVPTLDDLRIDLPLPSAELFDTMRAFLLSNENILEEMRWYGDCWFWTISYYLKGENTDDDLPIAVIIPAPDNLQVAAPLDRDFLAQLNTRRMKRAIRDGIDLAAEPYSTQWAVWPVNAKNLLEELVSLLKQRLSWLQGN
jgi:hypothetical protein